MSLTELNPGKLSVVYQHPGALRPRANNPRTHSQKQIGQIAKAIRRFGFINPILVDEENSLVAGHGRLAAAKALGLDEVPTVRLTDMSEAEIRAYVIADNRLAENAGWDRSLLGLELQYLSELDIDFDVTVTGFELPEIDLLIGELSLAGDGDGAADAAFQPAHGRAVTRSGDIWRSAAHRLACGDSTQAETYQRLLGDARAQMVFTDPPYNVPIAGHVGGLGSIQHREFAMASGEMSQAEFTTFLRTVFGHLGKLFGRWRSSFPMHGLAPLPGNIGCRDRRLYGTKEHLRLGQEQWRHGVFCTGHSTSLCSFSNQAPRHTLTMSSWASTADTVRTSGATPALIALAAIARTLISIQPSSPWQW